MYKFFPVIAMLLVSSCRRAAPSSYPEEGPYYQLSAVLPGPAVQAERVWMAKGVQIVRQEDFLIPVTFVEPAGSAPGLEGHVQFGPARKLCEDGPRISTRVVPVRGTSLLVLVGDDHKRLITVSVLDLSSGQRRELASFPHAARDAEDGACAVTRSGRHVLLVGPKKIRIWDVVNWTLVEEVDRGKSLSTVRATLMRGTGNPGDWLLTDDLQYILVEPTGSAWFDWGYAPADAMPLTVRSVAVDLLHDGVVFDRQAGTAWKFPGEISPPPNVRVVDAEVAGDRLSLLYSLGMGPDIRVVVADGAGHVRAAHSVKSPLVELAGWEPERDQVWLWDRDGESPLPNDHPEADNHLIAWDAVRDRERRFRVPVDQIQRAVDGAK